MLYKFSEVPHQFLKDQLLLQISLSEGAIPDSRKSEKIFLREYKERTKRGRRKGSADLICKIYRIFEKINYISIYILMYIKTNDYFLMKIVWAVNYKENFLESLFLLQSEWVTKWVLENHRFSINLKQFNINNNCFCLFSKFYIIKVLLAL